MKITTKILSIPPYISTAWTNISALHVASGQLRVTLKSGSTIDIPQLDASIIEKIFAAHEKVMEKETPQRPQMPEFPMPISGLEFGGIMQHNQKLAQSPDLPTEAIEKIREMIKGIDFDQEGLEMPAAEPHCNCPYCQIARIMNDEVVEEEEVSDEELTFRDESAWQVEQAGDKLFTIKNSTEQYSVFLGDPIGCTCGEKNCEHIRIVLNT